MNRIKDKVLMAALVESGVRVACDTNVINKGYSGLFYLTIEKSAWNMGYGTKLLNEMLNWATIHGATKAYLQIVADNKPTAVYIKNRDTNFIMSFGIVLAARLTEQCSR